VSSDPTSNTVGLTRGSTGRASVGFASFRAPVSHNVLRKKVVYGVIVLLGLLTLIVVLLKNMGRINFGIVSNAAYRYSYRIYYFFDFMFWWDFRFTNAREG
jgi:hypothetical protein